MTRGTTRAMRVVESNKRPAHRGLKRRPAIPIAWFARLHRGVIFQTGRPLAREVLVGVQRDHTPMQEDGVAPASTQQALALHHYEIASGRFSLPRTREDDAMPSF